VNSEKMKFSIRLLYLYLFAFVGLLITVIGSIQMLDLALKTYVFKVSEYTYYPEQVKIEGQVIDQAELDRRNKEEQENQRKRQISTSLAMIFVGSPLYLYHWQTIKKENREN